MEKTPLTQLEFHIVFITGLFCWILLQSKIFDNFLVAHTVLKEEITSHTINLYHAITVVLHYYD